MPHMATCADDILMVRSMHTDQFNHHPAQLVLHCGRPFFGLPTIGSWLTYGLGSESQEPAGLRRPVGRPRHQRRRFALAERVPAVGLRGRAVPQPGGAGAQSGEPAGPAAGAAAARPRRPARNERRALPARCATRRSPAGIAGYELAFRMQAAAPELIDLSEETQGDARSLRRRPRPILPSAAPSAAAGPGQYNAFATNCLLARRLVERGVRFVSLFHASWDHHSNLDVELPHNCGMADQPVAALIKDLKQRGLLDETLVILAGEFGRTPLGENRAGLRRRSRGRDHHPFAFTSVMAGGGVKGGHDLRRDRRDRLVGRRRSRST